ncbi:MAG: hypothetical protein KDB18_05805 [Salinibacterium sp.]|nr:hypothetical protein [Salinibacterium sp.]
MHAVVNKLTLAKPLDDALLGAIDRELGPTMRKQEGFVGFHVVSVSDSEAILVVLFDSRERLDAISREIAAPWFAEHVRPYLGGPVERVVGEVVYSSEGA